MMIPRDGVYKTKFTLEGFGSGHTAYGRIYKNGAAFGTEQTEVDGGPVVKEEDLTFSEGDYIELYHKTSSGIIDTHCSNFRLLSAVKLLG